MKTLILLFTLTATPALADASICFTVTPQSGGTASTCWKLTNANLADMVEAYTAAYFSNGVEVTPANPDTGTPAVTRAPTNGEVFKAISEGLRDGTIANVQSYRKAKASKAAIDGLPPIVIQP